MMRLPSSGYRGSGRSKLIETAYLTPGTGSEDLKIGGAIFPSLRIGANCNISDIALVSTVASYLKKDGDGVVHPSQQVCFLEVAVGAKWIFHA